MNDSDLIEVVKIGGNVIDDTVALKSFLKDFAKIPGKKVLVHGGGKEATRLSETLGIETMMIEGRRVTDSATIDVVTMVYAGLINKRIVSILQEQGCDAIGLSGADGNILNASRRSPHPIDYGYVGDLTPASLNVSFISSLLDLKKVPVFCAICHDGIGTLLNCNADSVASAVAIGTSKIAPTRLTYCFEKSGVMKDIADEKSVIPVITHTTFNDLKKEGIVSKGMVPKIKNALDAADLGVKEIRICKAEDILGDGGTTVIAE